MVEIKGKKCFTIYDHYDAGAAVLDESFIDLKKTTFFDLNKRKQSLPNESRSMSKKKKLRQ